MRRPIRRLLAVAALLALTACATPTRDGALYQDLGAEPGIDRLVTALLDRCYADPRINGLFDPNEREYLHERIVEQFCAESGGPCEYTGLPMDEAHSGMAIGHHEFDAFVEDLILAMEDVDLPYRTQNRLLAIFAPMRPDVVDK